MLPLAVAAFCACSHSPTPSTEGLKLLFEVEGMLPGAHMERLHHGAIYARWETKGPVTAHVLAVNLRNKDLILRPILGSGRIDGGPATRETLASMARRTGALAALSGGYFTHELNVTGLTIIDGRLHFSPDPPERSGIVMGRDNSVWIGRFHPDNDKGLDYYQALTGGPKLLERGKYHWDRDGDTLNGDIILVAPEIMDARQAQSALCVTRDRRTMFWVYVEGPDSEGGGITPAELGGLLTRLQCEEGLKFSGGVAAGLALRGQAVGGSAILAAPVGNALGLYVGRTP